MKQPKFHLDQWFVFMVGIAALIHSTWSIATFSGGEAPTVTGDPLTILSWVWWCVPGFLAAFALEVGQVETARQIKRGQGRRFKVWRVNVNVKVITFVLLSAGTYLFQLVYLLHHFPTLPMSAGLSVTSQAAAKTVMEIVTWLSPLLLPLSMWMSVASDERELTDQYAPLGKPIIISDPNLVNEPALGTLHTPEGKFPFLLTPHPVKSQNGNEKRE